MTCYKPLIRYQFNNLLVGRADGRKTPKGVIIPNSQLSKFELEHRLELSNGDITVQNIPCGKCIGCRLDKSRDWATRCMLEASECESYFVTLTFDDAHIPKDGSIRKEHLQKFMKDLRNHFKRKYNDDGIRFYGVGEYGSESGRCHYHVCLFNIHLRDLNFYKITRDYDTLYTSEELFNIWKNGFVVVGDLTWQSAAYVSRYCTKKIYGDKATEHYEGREPEFSLCSRRPGIGGKYYADYNSIIYRDDSIICPKKDGSVLRLKPPKYFDRLLREENEDFYNDLKLERQDIGKLNNASKLSKTSNSMQDILDIEHRSKILQTQKLKRSLDND